MSETTAALDRLRAVGLLPVLRLPTADDARAMAEVLIDAGLEILEVPLTVPDAASVIAALVARHGDRVIVGAGTVLDRAGAELCLAAGARFIVSPCVDLETIAHCRAARVPILAGALSPTEIVTAWRAGAAMVKVFPCSAVGGPAYLAAIKGPLPQVELVPTGGVSLATAGAYIAAGAVALGVGGDLVDVARLRSGRQVEIADHARAYLKAVTAARGPGGTEVSRPAL